MIDVIFIGAGPIGLLGAIQLKLSCPDLNILMFDKHEVPSRNHSMYVNQDSFSGMDRSQEFAKILDSISSKVIISDLEKLLRDYAQSIGITIKYQEVKNFEELTQQYPDTNYFVGSGGLRGIVHPQVFQNDNQVNETLRYAVEVKYKAVGKTRSLNKVTELPGVIAHTKHLVSEYVGHLKNEVTPISLRIFVDESTHERMKKATFKEPYTLADKNKIPSELFETITHYLRARHHLANEEIVEGSLKISALTLSIYASRSFCTRWGKKTIFQIGEEAFACPFYRSFNDNASCIPAFTKAMKALLEKKPVIHDKISSSTIFSISQEQQEPLSYYQHTIQSLVNSEIRTIAVLNFGIDMLESSASSLRATPAIPSSKLSFKTGGKAFLAEVKGDDNHGATHSSCVLL